MMREEQDALSAASNVYEAVMENDRVRVLRVVFRPGDRAAPHHHPDHLAVAIKGGKLRLTASGKSDTVDIEPGQTLYLDEVTHNAENVGDSEIDLIVIELK
jgi:quercetin dioxygenase-like cupin family protein